MTTDGTYPEIDEIITLLSDVPDVYYELNIGGNIYELANTPDTSYIVNRYYLSGIDSDMLDNRLSYLGISFEEEEEDVLRDAYIKKVVYFPTEDGYYRYEYDPADQDGYFDEDSEGGDGERVKELVEQANSEYDEYNVVYLIKSEMAKKIRETSILSKLAKDLNPDIRKELASNPHLPKDIIGELAGDEDYEVRDNLLDNPVLSKEERKHILNIKMILQIGYFGFRKFLKSSTYSEAKEYFKDIVKSKPNFLTAILERFSLDIIEPDIIDYWISLNKEEIVNILAESIRHTKNLTSSFLIDLFHRSSTNFNVLKIIVEHPNCPDELKDKFFSLAQEKNLKTISRARGVPRIDYKAKARTPIKPGSNTDLELLKRLKSTLNEIA